VLGQFYDPDKEQNFIKEREEEAKIHGKDLIEKMPKAWWENGSLYNPINCEVDDEHWLYLKDLKDKNKWKRYELRYDMERKIHKEGLSEEERMK